MSYKAYKNKLNVELKELLNGRGLKVGGNKSDLIERLRADDKARKAKKQKIKNKRKLKEAQKLAQERKNVKKQKLKAAAKKHRIVFMGNPGAGKSTLLNSMIQQTYFKSGSNGGQGVTREFKEFIISSQGGQTIFVDTPGLNETSKKRQVAEEISKAIEPGVETTLVMVCSYADDRVPDDFVRTVRIIMSSFEKEFPFLVVFNKVPPKGMLPEEKAKITDYCSKTLAMFGLTNARFHFVPFHKEAFGEPDMLLKDASVYNRAIMHAKRCKTNGVTIQLKRAALQWSLFDDEYHTAMNDLKGEMLHLTGKFRTWAQDEHGVDLEPSCPVDERLKFNTSNKAHCQHCVWWDIHKSRDAEETVCTSRNSSPCLLCHVS